MKNSALIFYIPGEDNILADAFSRLPRREDKLEAKAVELENVYTLEDHYFSFKDPELFDCFLNLPEMDEPEENPTPP